MKTTKKQNKNKNKNSPTMKNSQVTLSFLLVKYTSSDPEYKSDCIDAHIWGVKIWNDYRPDIDVTGKKVGLVGT